MITKAKLHGGKVTDFYNKEMPTRDSNHTCFAVTCLNSAPKKRWELLSASVFKRV